MHAKPNKPKCTLSKSFTKYIPVFNVFKFLECLVALHSYAIHRRLIVGDTAWFFSSWWRCIIVGMHARLLLHINLVYWSISWMPSFFKAFLIVCWSTGTCSWIFKFLVIALLILFSCTTNPTKLLHLSSWANGLLGVGKIIGTGTTSGIHSSTAQLWWAFACIHVGWTKSLSCVGPLSRELHINIFMTHSLHFFIGIRSVTIDSILSILVYYHLLWRLTISIRHMTWILLVITHLHIILISLRYSMCVRCLLLIIICINWHWLGSLGF